MEEIDQRIYDALQKMHEQEVSLVFDWSLRDEGRLWANGKLAAWLRATVVAERDRRNDRAASHPALDLSDWTHCEVAGGLTLATVWERSAPSPLLAQMLTSVHDAMLAAAINRLVDYDTLAASAAFN